MKTQIITTKLLTLSTSGDISMPNNNTNNKQNFNNLSTNKLETTVNLTLNSPITITMPSMTLSKLVLKLLDYKIF